MKTHIVTDPITGVAVGGVTCLNSPDGKHWRASWKRALIGDICINCDQAVTEDQSGRLTVIDADDWRMGTPEDMAHADTEPER